MKALTQKAAAEVAAALDSRAELRRYMTYAILTCESPSGLSDLVNQAINDGWKPIGGVAITEYQRDSWPDGKEIYSEYVQAIILE